MSPQSFGSWAGHTILNVLGFIPVFGGVADAFNAVWYLYEGNYAEAIACAVGAIPLVGNLATGFKMGSTFVKGCNIAANVGKASIGFYNGVQNVMNIDSMIRSGTGRWYDYVGQGVLFGLNMFVSASGAMGAWSGISNLVGELNYKKMQRLAQEVSWDDIDGGEKLTRWLEDVKGSSETELFLPEEYYQKLDDNIAKAISARDAEVARIQSLSKTQQKKIATVVAGVDLRTEEIYVGVKNSEIYAGNASCAEDIVFRGLGGNVNANIIMTPAIRPRTGKVISVCLRCQTKYPVNQFVKGTTFQ